MDWYVIVLRVIHIAAGIFWVGAAFVLFLFIQPSVKELGPEGQRFMGHDVDWIRSGPGVAFTVGGLAAITTLALGLSITKPAVDRVGALGQEIATGGGQPTPSQVSEMQRLQARVALIGRVSMVLLTIAVVAMAIARFL
jgi:nitric oxide reductase large subunit